MAEGRPETWEVWLYSMLATGILCIVSLSGALLLLRGMHKHFRDWMRELMALSAGTLIGATLFSMFPETVEQLGFGLDVTCTILGGIAFGFLAENVAHAHGDHKRRKKSVYCDEVEEVILSPRAERRTVPPHQHAHTHHHNATIVPAPHADLDAMDKLGDFEREDAAMVIFHHAQQKQKDGAQARRASEPALPSSSKQQKGQEQEQGKRTPKQSSGMLVIPEHHHHIDHDDEEDPRGYLAVISLAGDALHNIVDGALIGAAFQSGVGQGVIITLAIAIHELPQEMADFAVLLHAGLTVNQALFTNFLVSLTAILGACISIAIGDESVTPYFVPFAGGMFMYLALTCLLPEVMHSGHKGNESHGHGIDWSHADAYIAATRESSPAPSSAASPRYAQRQSQAFPPALRVDTGAEPIPLPVPAPVTATARGKPHVHVPALPVWVRIRAILFLGLGLGIMALLLLIPHSHAHGGDEDDHAGDDDGHDH